MVARKQYLLRIDPDLWADVEKWAADELRSVNAQVEYILRDAVRRRRSGRTGSGATPAGGRPTDGADATDSHTGNEGHHGH